SSDVTYYQNWARDIIRGATSPQQVFWGFPLYPYFLAAIKTLAFGNTGLVRFFHLILGSLNCVLVYFLARAIFNQNTARLSALLMAVNFTLIHYDWLMMPVTLLITLSLIILIVVTDFQLIKNRKECFLLGLLLGLTILGDGKFLIFLFLLSIYFGWT